MPNGVNARTIRNIAKITAQRLALLKGSKRNCIQDVSGLVLYFRVVRWHGRQIMTYRTHNATEKGALHFVNAPYEVIDRADQVETIKIATVQHKKLEP